MKTLRSAWIRIVILICTSAQLFLLHKVICRLHVSTTEQSSTGIFCNTNLYVSTAVFITQGNYMGYMFRLLNSHLQASSAIIICTSAQLFLLHKVITWATCFDYWTVIFRPILQYWFVRQHSCFITQSNYIGYMFRLINNHRPILYRLSHRMLCTHWDPMTIY